MDYSPRYPQPFTLWEVTQMDVPIITEEIARLQNSLEHLRKTQDGLLEALNKSHDPDFAQALEENASVIGSQEERISMLRMALSQKGVPVDSHCANGTNPPPAVGAVETTPSVTTPDEQGEPVTRQQHTAIVSDENAVPNIQHEDIVIDDDGGIDL